MKKLSFLFTCAFFLILFFNQLLGDPTFVILTGGPGCGKTTLLHALTRRGCKTLEESATMIIREERLAGNPKPWINLCEFQEKILQRQLNLLESVKNFDGVVICDRSVPDGLAYFDLAQQPRSETLIHFSQTIKYALVFILDFLDTYDLDINTRHEDQQEAMRIHDAIKKVYEEFGYPLITIPKMNIEDRTTFVLDELAKRGFKTRLS